MIQLIILQYSDSVLLLFHSHTLLKNPLEH